MAGRCPAGAYDGPTGERSGGRDPVASVAALRHTDEGERFDDFAIRQEWWTGDALPTPRWCAGNWPGCPRSRWSAVKEKVEELLGHGTQVWPIWPGPRKYFRYLCGRWK